MQKSSELMSAEFVAQMLMINSAVLNVLSGHQSQ